MDKHKRFSISLTTSLILLLSAVLLSAAARMIPGFAQAYSTSVYVLLQGSLGRVCGLVPFSVSEMLCILLPVLLLIVIIRTAVRHRPARYLIKCVFLAVCILLFLYAANCGVNYYRDPFVDQELFTSAEFTEEDLTDFCEYSVSQLSKLYSGEVSEYPEGTELEDKAVKAMQDLAGSDMKTGGDTDELIGFYPRPKRLTVLSRFFSMMGVSGIYSPFTIEANVNGEMPGLEMPFTACHELSHLRGYMNEGEANYIGWLACINSDDTSFNRSGWLMAWIYAGNSLYRIDEELYYELRDKLPAAAVQELEENSRFWATHKNRASEVQDRVNDAYLRSNGQDEGIMTYGQLTTLMLIWYSNQS